MLKVLSERNPGDLPWGDLGVDVVIESTGIFTKRGTAPPTLTPVLRTSLCLPPVLRPITPSVYGVNHDDFDARNDKVVSNASCTTNCIVPMVKVLDDAFTVKQGLMTTVHAYTGDQALVDGPTRISGGPARRPSISSRPPPARPGQPDWSFRRCRASWTALALRVPVPTGSLTDFTAVVEGEPSIEESTRL